MEISDVVKIRNILANIKDSNGNACAISIIGDNMVLADEALDFLKWDDDNGILYIVKFNPEKRQNAKVNVRCTSYENIQYISANIDKSRFAEFAKTNLGFTDIQVKNVISKFYPNISDFIAKESPTRGKDATISSKI